MLQGELGIPLSVKALSQIQNVSDTGVWSHFVIVTNAEAQKAGCVRLCYGKTANMVIYDHEIVINRKGCRPMDRQSI